MKNEVEDILASGKEWGWVLEPEAKRLLGMAGISIPDFTWATTPEEALTFAHERGYPVVAKVVSPNVLHKSDVGGVQKGITTDGALIDAFERMRGLDGFAGLLVEKVITGIELFVGAKVDYQFGPVILLGLGGTAVEIYRDTVLRMAPLTEGDVRSMVRQLKGRALLEGFRGSQPIDLVKLAHMMVSFSDLVMAMGDEVASVDLNPVMCAADHCVVVDARIMLSGYSRASKK